MEKHVCEFNDRWGIRGKEESFIKQGHQTGIQENQRYAGLTNFVEETESTLQQRCNASHPLVVQQQQKVSILTKWKKGEQAEEKKKVESVKNAKEIKRDSYVSKYKIDKN